jgi:hypothetical protein
MTRALTPEEIERMAADPARRMRMPDLTQIDRTQPFVPETYTQLYYTPVYASLHREHRLRYNQLFGLRINEYIMMLEADLVERLLSRLRRRHDVAADSALVRCIDAMIAEEKHHYGCFVALNRACHPALYAEQERFFSVLPAPVDLLITAAGLVAGRLAFALWYFMAMEESSTALARAMMRESTTETLGPLEPTFAAVHREHLKDETRHLQIDAILADLVLAQAGRRTRLLNAALFKAMLRTVTRPTPAGSGAKVIRQLVREMPELSWRENEMIAAVLALDRDRAFQASLFSREIMPLTFGLFDRMPEFADLSATMVGYDRG